MAKKKRDPELQARIQRAIEAWPEQRRETEEWYARLQERWRQEDERRERRRALFRRILLLRRS
jgi:hypothetical protein